jgi:hypothetical protein
MNKIFFGYDKFIIYGLKLGIITYNVNDVDNEVGFSLRSDYLNWSSNLKVYAESEKFDKKEVLYIQEHLDFLNMYDVIDSSSKKNAGILKYHFGSWEALDGNNNYFIVAKDDLLKEILSLKYYPYQIVDKQGHMLVKIKKTSSVFQPWRYVYEVDFSPDKKNVLDRRVAFALLTMFVLASERMATLEKIKIYIYLRWKALVGKFNRKGS